MLLFFTREYKDSTLPCSGIGEFLTPGDAALQLATVRGQLEIRSPVAVRR